MRLLITLVVLILASAIGLYAALPWLVAHVAAPRLAASLGVGKLTIDLGYPGLEGATVHTARMVRSGLTVELADARLDYDLDSLLALRVISADIGSLSVTFSPATETEPPGPAAEENTAAAVDAYLLMVPADRVRIEALEVVLPESDFLARGQASFDAGTVEVDLTGVAPEFAQDLRTRLVMDGTGSLTVQVEDPDDAAPSSIRLEGHLAEDKLPIEVGLSLDGSLFGLVQQTLGIPVGLGRLRGSMHTTLPGLPSEVPDWRSLDATGDFALEWSLAEAGIRIEEASGTFEGAGGEIALDMSSTVVVERDGITVRSETRDGWFRFDGVEVASDDPATRLSLASESISGAVALRAIHLIVAEPAVVIAGALQSVVDDSDMQGDVDARVSLAEPITGDLSFTGSVAEWPVVIAGTFGRDGTRWQSDVTLNRGPVFELPLAIRYDSASGVGTVTARHQLKIDQPLLAAVVPGWSEPFDLDRGTLHIDGTYTWGKASQGALRLGLEKARGNYEDYVGTGIHGDLRLELNDDGWRLTPSDLQLDRLEVGFPVTDVRFTLSGNASILHVDGLTAQLLGGSAAVGPFDYALPAGGASLVLELTGIDLQELLALEGDDVTGSGKLDGELPVVIVNNTPSVAGGQVRATGPGTIRLSSGLTSAFTQPGMDIALKALEDFSFEVLESSVDYRDNGDLQLGLRIQGRNPEIEKGRPIHYNLNVSENIPVLLRSLRLSEAVGKQIEKRVVR